MFLFIGGIQPRTIVLDDDAGPCAACTETRIVKKRVDHYFTLFFLPLFPVSRGAPFFECGKCGTLYDMDRVPAGEGGYEAACRNCGRRIFKGYSWCPWCGEKL